MESRHALPSALHRRIARNRRFQGALLDRETLRDMGLSLDAAGEHRKAFGAVDRSDGDDRAQAERMMLPDAAWSGRRFHD
jgi:hypothetical protein